MRHVRTSCRDIARVPEGYNHSHRNHSLTQRDWKPALAQGTPSPAASDHLTPSIHETSQPRRPGVNCNTTHVLKSLRDCRQLKAVHVCSWGDIVHQRLVPPTPRHCPPLCSAITGFLIKKSLGGKGPSMLAVPPKLPA